MIVTQAVQQSTPLHQFDAKDVNLVKLGRNLDKLDQFIWGAVKEA